MSLLAIYSFGHLELLITSRLGASRDEIAAEAARTQNAYMDANQQVEELTALAEVSLPLIPIVDVVSDGL